MPFTMVPCTPKVGIARQSGVRIVDRGQLLRDPIVDKSLRQALGVDKASDDLIFVIQPERHGTCVTPEI